MIKKYKLIAFDIDGTILDSNYQVCRRLKSTVATLAKLEYKFILVSARIPASVLSIARELNIDTVIGLNGSLITNQQRDILYSNTFNTNNFIDIIHDLDRDISRNYYHHFDWMLEYPTVHSDLEVEVHKNDCTPIRQMDISQLNKITLIGENDRLRTIQLDLQAKTDLLVSFSHDNFLEVTDKKVSKYSGLEYYAKHYLNIATDEIIAFGDGENDIPMLGGVGLGVAMSNASDLVKQSAHDIAESHDNEGVAKYLEQLINNNIL